METLLPSEIARLVYGYLIEENCHEAAAKFLETSSQLKECLIAYKNGKKFQTKFEGRNLVEMLDILPQVKNQAQIVAGELPQNTLLWNKELLELLCLLSVNIIPCMESDDEGSDDGSEQNLLPSIAESITDKDVPVRLNNFILSDLSDGSDPCPHVENDILNQSVSGIAGEKKESFDQKTSSKDLVLSDIEEEEDEHELIDNKHEVLDEINENIVTEVNDSKLVLIEEINEDVLMANEEDLELVMNEEGIMTEEENLNLQVIEETNDNQVNLKDLGEDPAKSIPDVEVTSRNGGFENENMTQYYKPIGGGSYINRCRGKKVGKGGKNNYRNRTIYNASSSKLNNVSDNKPNSFHTKQNSSSNVLTPQSTCESHSFDPKKNDLTTTHVSNSSASKSNSTYAKSNTSSSNNDSSNPKSNTSNSGPLSSASKSNSYNAKSNTSSSNNNPSNPKSNSSNSGPLSSASKSNSYNAKSNTSSSNNPSNPKSNSSNSGSFFSTAKTYAYYAKSKTSSSNNSSSNPKSNSSIKSDIKADECTSSESNAKSSDTKSKSSIKSKANPLALKPSSTISKVKSSDPKANSSAVESNSSDPHSNYLNFKPNFAPHHPNYFIPNPQFLPPNCLVPKFNPPNLNEARFLRPLLNPNNFAPLFNSMTSLNVYNGPIMFNSPQAPPYNPHMMNLPASQTAFSAPPPPPHVSRNYAGNNWMDSNAIPPPSPVPFFVNRHVMQTSSYGAYPPPNSSFVQGGVQVVMKKVVTQMINGNHPGVSQSVITNHTLIRPNVSHNQNHIPMPNEKMPRHR